MKRRILSILLAVTLLVGMIAPAGAIPVQANEYNIEDYANVINQVSNGFSDNGIWLKYCLHSATDTAKFGGFPGPKVMHNGRYLSSSGIRLVLADADGKAIDLTKAQATMTSYPGRLVQKYTLNGITVTMTLICATDRSAMVCAEITNNTGSSQTLRVSKTGTLNYGTLSAQGRCVSADMGGEYFDIRFDRDAAVSLSGRTFTADLGTVTLAAGESTRITHTESYLFNSNEKTEETALTASILADPASHLEANHIRWEGYLARITQADLSGTVVTGENEELDYKRAAVKAVMVLTGNYRSAAGKLHYGGHQPFGDAGSMGFWAWDSWKHVVATSTIDPGRAKEELRSLFSYQIQAGDSVRPQDAGAIVDVIDFNGINNDRDSKPPLSGWAIYNCYAQTGDLEFLEEMYPKLVAYHQWWYRNRDIDGNGIAEFGAMQSSVHYSTTELDADGDPKPNVSKILEAAAWESGMDNATRFDISGYGSDDVGILVYKVKDDAGKIVGYTINQESVDLNSMLYAEKVFLMAMAEILGREEEAAKYAEEAAYVMDYINYNMYDPGTGFYYDLQTNADGSVKKLLVNRGKGTEGWLPLWASLATPAQAAAVVENMLDEDVFYTTMPFPTAARDNPKYAPTQYWRGPVWMDQAMFAVEALHNYGYHEEAEAAAYKLFDNAEGLLTDGTIRENYNPETGGGLNATNFSWSSAAFYGLFINTLSGDRTNTCQQILPVPEDDPEILDMMAKAEVSVIRQVIQNSVVLSEDDLADLLAAQQRYEALPDDLKSLISQQELDTLRERIALAQSVADGVVSVYLEDQSANGYHINASVRNSKQSVSMIPSGDGLALSGWFELNHQGARKKFTDVISSGFTVEALVDLDGNTGFSYIAGKCDDCFGLRTESGDMLFYIYNGSGWKTARLDLLDSDYEGPAHVVASWDGGTMTLTVNGRQTVTTGAGTPKTNSKCLALGIGEYDDGKTADYHNAHIFHSFRVYNEALSVDTLEKILPSDDRVELWYDFDRLTYSGTTEVVLDPGNGDAPYTVEASVGMKLSKPTEPVRNGYVFRGWFLGEKKWDFGSDLVYPGMTLTGKWYMEGLEDPDTTIAAANQAKKTAEQAREMAEAAKQAAQRAGQAAKDAEKAAREAKDTVSQNKESAVAAQAAAETARAAADAAALRAEAAEQKAAAAEAAAVAAATAAEQEDAAAVLEARNAAQAAADAASSEANAAVSAEAAARSAASAANARLQAQSAREDAEAAAEAAAAAQEKAEAAETAAVAAAKSAAEDKTAAEAARAAAENAREAAETARAKAEKAGAYAEECAAAAEKSEQAAAKSDAAAAENAGKAAASAAEAAASAAEASRQAELIAQYAASAAQAQQAAQESQVKAEQAQKAAQDAANQTEADRLAAEAARKEAEEALAAAQAAAELETARQNVLSDIMAYVAKTKISGLSGTRVQAFNDVIREATGQVRSAEDVSEMETAYRTMEIAADTIVAGNPFEDVGEDDWFFDNVEFVSARGFMVGMSDTLFVPDGSLTRGQFVTILHRLEGAPEVAYQETFSDVPQDQWYTDAILWANTNGIVLGYNTGAFGVNDPITREQMVVMMSRFAGDYKGLELEEGSELAGFADWEKVSGYAVSSMDWAVTAGLIQGSNDPDGLHLNPGSGASRAQCAAIIQRFLENIVK